MASKDAGSRLLTVVVILTLCVGCVTARFKKLEPRSKIDQLKKFETYIEELEFLEDKERRQGIKAHDETTVEGDAIIETSNVLVKDTVVVASDDEYPNAVNTYLELWNKYLRVWTNKVTIANWNFETDITEQNEEIVNKAYIDFAIWEKDLVKNAKILKEHPKYSSLDDNLQRQIRFMAFTIDPTDEEDVKQLIDVQTDLQQTYSEATVDVYTEDATGNTSVVKLKLEPDLTKIMTEGGHSDYLLAAWWAWRNATGPQMRDQYSKMVRLLNRGAKENGFPDYATAWIASQFDETENLEEIAEALWNEMLPLYQQLHAYVRTKLQKIYPEYNHIFKDGGIPAHLLGNMWAQNWENIYELVKPYKEIDEPDYDLELKAQDFTVDRMFETAEKFFTSIGLFPMSPEFNERSMKVRPDKKEVVCHASASDFFSKKPERDFRIKMCTEVNMDSFETIHHEMGHIEYFMAYQDQPAVYRDGANSAFHEAIGDTISLSFRSSKHLQDIGLSGGSDVISETRTEDKEDKDRQGDINFLLKRALFKIAFLPFGYMIDKWRWAVFRGDTTHENYNRDWWKLRLQYQGLVAPVERSEADFDPGAKFHIPSNSPYICYFVSFVVQFQFYKSMCEASGHTGPLFECDFYQSEEAGQKLKDMMVLGKSVPWPEAMEKLTGAKEISTNAIKEYFQPLLSWLEKENKEKGAEIGWASATINWNKDI